MEYLVKVTSTYAVCCPEGGELTDDKGMKETLEAGKQYHFTAQSDKWYTTAPITLTKCSTFKRAASALGLLGGGVKSELPAGYLRADFLESTGTQYIDTGFLSKDFYDSEVKTRFALSPNETMGYNGTYNPGGFSLQFWKNATENRVGGVFFSSVSLNMYGVEVSHFSECCMRANFFSVDGKRVEQDMPTTAREEVEKKADKFFLFARYRADSSSAEKYSEKICYFSSQKGAKKQAQFLPCITNTGTPCMYETVTKQPFHNFGTGRFIAGFTLAQARKLGAHLPAGGGALTISLSTGYEQDSAVAESLETAREKGWTLTVQTYEAEASAATFGMRRVWVRRQQDAQGGYVDADGVRWAVEWCVDMLTPDGSTPDAHGYELYRSTEAAVAYWELTPWTDPEAEELLTTESL